MRHALPLITLLLLAAPALAQKEFGFDNRKGSGQNYLKPEESLKKMTVPPEFEVKLFAAEPDCVNPIAFTVDEKGRIWLVESFEYPSRTPKGKAPRDRIVILEDTDGDGKCDKRTVFAEGKDFPVPEERKKAGLGAFDMASGIEVGHGGVFVGAPPYLWFIETKDDKPVKFETLLKGFGSEDTHETLNTFQWGPDGWLYGCHGVFTQSDVTAADDKSNADRKGAGEPTRMNAAVWRYQPKAKKFEIFAEGTSNPWGLDWRNTDGQFILACCVIPHLYHIVPGGVYKRQAGASYNPYAYGAVSEISDHTFHKESGWAHAGLVCLDAPHIPEKYRDSVIFGSIHGCSVKQNILKANGSSFTASRGDDFLVSGDKNFRPVNMKWGPHGDIYLIDWHDQMPCHQAKPEEIDYGHGRVFRIQLKDRKGGKAEDLGKKRGGELVDMLGGKTPYESRTAMRLLSERAGESEKGVGAALGERFEAAMMARDTSLTGAWAFFLYQSGKTKYAPLVLNYYRSLFEVDAVFALKTSIARAALLRLFATGKKFLDPSALGRLADLETSSLVRRELASAAIRLADESDVSDLVHALMAHKEDAKDPLIPHLTWLAYEKVLAKQASGGRTSLGEPGPQGPRVREADSHPPTLRSGFAQGKPADAPRSPKPHAPGIDTELAWLADNAAGNPFVSEQIIPRAVRRLVATEKPEHLAACVRFVQGLKDATAKRQALGGLVEALKGQVVDPPAEWKDAKAAFAKSDDKAVRDLGNKLAVSFRDPEAIARALEALKFGNTVDDRIDGLRTLVLLRHKDISAIILNTLRDETHPWILAEAARQLAAVNDPKLAPAVIKDWATYTQPLQSELANSLASRRESAKALLTAMSDKKIDRTALTDNAVQKMQSFNDKELNALIEKAWGRTRATPAELTKLIDKTRETLYSKPASFEAGRKVFDAQCAKCHKFDGRGNEVGPQLDGAARDIEYLLANVLDPNRVIGAPYFVRTANLLDGQVVQGVLHAEDDKSITLKLEGAVLKTIARKNLDGPVKVAEKSLMPEGLAAGMSEQDFRDLLRYVMTSPFVTVVGVDGKAQAAGVPGRILLPGPKGDATVTADFTADAGFKTKLLVGATDTFTASIDGKEVGKGNGTGKRAAPDTEGFDVQLAAGKHTLTLVVSAKAGGGAVFARFLDPDRRLSYPEK